MKQAPVSAADAASWMFSVSKKFVLNNKLSVGARLLLIAMRSFVGSEGDCFPSRKLLCDKLSVGKDTLSKWMAELESAGHLERHQEREHNGFGRNVYRTSFSPLCPGFQDTESQATETQATENRTLSITTSQVLPLLKEVPLNKVLAAPKQKSRTSFVKPTREEVHEYGREIDMTVDQCESFYDHFESNGWKVSGKAPMVDWKASLRNWKRNDERFHAGRNGNHAGVKNVPCAQNDWR